MTTHQVKNKKSHIDHIIINDELAEQIVQVNILNSPKDQINNSDHRAIKLTVENDTTNEITMKKSD